MEEGEKYINEEHCVICQEQDNVGLREYKDGIASLIEYANQLKLEVLRSHLAAFRKAARKSIRLNSH